jgi:hypothetical protein
MNIIRLMGGIGNQMYGYALGRVFTERGIDVAYDLSWFKQTHDTFRPYNMDKFKTNIKICGFVTLPIKEEEKFDPGIFSLDNYALVGYWQHPEYYTEILPQLRNEFQVRDELKTPEYYQMSEKIISGDSVAVHVRRGDYGPKLCEAYYTDAIARTKGDLFIFSEDMPWCRETFRKLDRNTTYVEMEDYLLFELIRLCKTKIICNSTFSYWAAMLGDGEVYCPNHWIGNGTATALKDWIQLEDYRRYERE